MRTSPSARAAATAALVALAALGPERAAGGDELVPGQRLVIRSGERVDFLASARGARFALPPPGSAVDPRVNGARLTLEDAGLVAGSFEAWLDASRWRGLGRPRGAQGYLFLGSADDPCRVVLLTRRTILAHCRSDVPIVTPLADAATVVLGLGPDATALRYCAEFGGEELANDERRTWRRAAPPPPACPVVACPSVDPLPSAALGGACWYLAPGTGCDGVCPALGLRSSAATRSYAGSDGTLAACSDVLGLLGLPPAVDADCGSVGLPGTGCSFVPDFGLSLRCTAPPTTPDASDPGIYRACACR